MESAHSQKVNGASQLGVPATIAPAIMGPTQIRRHGNRTQHWLRPQFQLEAHNPAMGQKGTIVPADMTATGNGSGVWRGENGDWWIVKSSDSTFYATNFESEIGDSPDR